MRHFQSTTGTILLITCQRLPESSPNQSRLRPATRSGVSTSSRIQFHPAARVPGTTEAR